MISLPATSLVSIFPSWHLSLRATAGILGRPLSVPVWRVGCVLWGKGQVRCSWWIWSHWAFTLIERITFRGASNQLLSSELFLPLFPSPRHLWVIFEFVGISEQRLRGRKRRANLSHTQVKYSGEYDLKLLPEFKTKFPRLLCFMWIDGKSSHKAAGLKSLTPQLGVGHHVHTARLTSPRKTFHTARSYVYSL